jgi:hypothetical protein
MADYEYDIFISYSHRDGAWVTTELLPRLEGAGLRVCIDERDFKIGTPSLVNMENAVDHSRHTLIVLTPAWVESAWTEFESLLIGVADPAGRRRRMLPVMLERCTPPARIAILTYADFTNAGDRCRRHRAGPGPAAPDGCRPGTRPQGEAGHGWRQRRS